MCSPRQDKLEAKTKAWLDEHKPSHRVGILPYLAFRKVPMAMTELARVTKPSGGMADPFSSSGLAYRAFRRGDAIAAYNLAIDCFNRRDLSGYRRWLRRAADAGDADAANQLARFETRLPHGAAFDVGRGRPSRADD